MRPVLVLFLTMGIACATAADAAERSARAPAADDRVCFAEKTTGSHLRKRICMTREEQERRRKEDQQAMERMRRSTGAGGFANKDP